MNYIKEINAFYDWLETNSVSDSVITLWHALMHINNKTGWKVEFAVSISTLQVKTGLSCSSIKRARNNLAQAGLIKWKQRNGNQSAIYEMIAFAAHCEPQSEPQSVPQSGPQSVPQSGPINKLNKTKQKDIGDKSPPTPKSLFEKIEERKAREKKFFESLLPFLESFPKEMIREFYDHWSEPNKSGTQMKWELQPTFELSRRLATWQRNSDRWGIKSKHDKNEATGEIDPRIQEKLAKFGGG